MDWLTQNKDIILVILSAAGFILAVVANIWSWKNSNRLSKIDRSSILRDIHNSIQLGRQEMKDIFDFWNKQSNKNISELSEVERANFISTYNEEYHKKSPDSPERKKSMAIKSYLDELDQLWQRVLNNEFSKEEAIKVMGPGINMDKELIGIYLEAHRAAHHGDKFWQNVPSFVEAAKEWQEKRFA